MSDLDSGPDSPPPEQGGILARSIEDELRQSYLGVRDERHRQPRIAGRARRSEAGASPRALTR